MVTCTGHIGIHEGADVRTYVRMYVRCTYVRTFMTTKFSHIDGLPYFLKYDAPRARAFGARGASLLPSNSDLEKSILLVLPSLKE